jgi:hypothetical protein
LSDDISFGGYDSQTRKAPVKFPAKFYLAKHYNSVMIGYSFEEVKRAVAYRGFNEVDEVDRPQSGGAGCGRFFSRPAQTLCC